MVEKVAADAAVKGAVITSGKDTFGGGADLTMLDKQREDYAATLKQKGEEAANLMVFERSRKLSQVYRRLETCGKPFVAALNGTAMGGCFEMALACHYRVAADNPRTRLGLPEIKVGLFPGAGGTQRIPRMMATGRRAAVPAQGRPDPARPRQEREADRRHRAGCRPREGREGLDQGRRPSRSSRGTWTASSCRAVRYGRRWA